jgi:hypothetical protein
LLGGLDEPLSPGEIQALRERFTISVEEAKSFEKSDYYATRLSPGPARLGEMLEESAFYSEDLQRFSASVMLSILLTFAFLSLIIAFGIPYAARDISLTIVRVFLAFLVFAMSADVIGAFSAHRRAAKEIRDVRHRLITADAAGYPFADVLSAFSDYQSAIERAPESIPYAYCVREKRLNQRWADYQHDRAATRVARGLTI